MNSRSLFKLVVYLANWLKLALIAFPVSAALVSLKQGNLQYGYSFFDVDHNWSIVIAIGISMTLNTWHTLSFEELGNFDLKQYLKQRQRYIITGTKSWTLAQVEPGMKQFVDQHRRWKSLEYNDHRIRVMAKNKFGFQDRVTLSPSEQGIIVESRPRFIFPFVDMARNLKNVQEVSKFLKEEEKK